MIDFTQSPDFMEGLKRAMLETLRGLDLPGGVSPAATPLADPAGVWLTTQQTLEFLGLSSSSFHRFRQRLKDEGQSGKLCVSYTLGPTEPRYQLASLRALMAEGAVGGGEPAAGKITALPQAGSKGKKAAA